MLNKLFLICALICIGQSNCIKLENICNTFRHNVALVINSVHVIEYNSTIRNISYYLETENYKYDDLVENKTVLEIIDRSKKVYYNNIRKIYSENFINNPVNLKEIDSIHKILHSTLLNLLEIKNHMPGKRNQFTSRIKDEFSRGDYFAHMLQDLNADRFMSVNYRKNLSLIRKIVSNLNSEDRKNFALKDDSAEYFHNFRNVVSFNKFVKDNSNQSDSIVFGKIYLPFYNPNYRKTNDCLPISKLPKFYHKTI